MPLQLSQRSMLDNPFKSPPNRERKSLSMGDSAALIVSSGVGSALGFFWLSFLFDEPQDLLYQVFSTLFGASPGLPEIFGLALGGSIGLLLCLAFRVARCVICR